MLRKAGFSGEVIAFETGVHALVFLRADALEKPPASSWTSTCPQ